MAVSPAVAYCEVIDYPVFARKRVGCALTLLVAAEHRRRGLGTALYELLRQRGCKVMVTASRLNNSPILAINRKLGYIPGPLELSYVKRMECVA